MSRRSQAGLVRIVSRGIPAFADGGGLGDELHQSKGTSGSLGNNTTNHEPRISTFSTSRALLSHPAHPRNLPHYFHPPHFLPLFFPLSLFQIATNVRRTLSPFWAAVWTAGPFWLAGLHSERKHWERILR